MRPFRWVGCGEHPRARGENYGEFDKQIGEGGTSPRTRGKHPRVLTQLLLKRNIPAHAGKTRSPAVVCSPATEHPRARGENQPTAHPATPATGTSPRTRGKPKVNSRSLWRVWEHPRARGENLTTSLPRPKIFGTSPRTRGKLFRGRVPRRAGRNIPAHAGKTTFLRTINEPYKEHPRARGENYPVDTAA